MKITYFKDVDAIYIEFLSDMVANSDAISEDVIVDCNEHGKIVGIEILNASKHLDISKPLEVDNLAIMQK
ncbi:MAG: DUF2283 domain-containing protein [Thermotogaceae bacterium]|nr:DUF2283 domain-containing protein [Thermotogaceae bacterium]